MLMTADTPKKLAYDSPLSPSQELNTNLYQVMKITGTMQAKAIMVHAVVLVMALEVCRSVS